MDVLTLRGVLTLDKSQYDSSLQTADKQAHSFGGRFSKALKVGAAAATAFGVATAVATKKLVNGAKDVAAYGDNVDKMSQKIGISAEAYQKWDYVMKRAGGNVDQLKMGMRTLSQQAEKNSDAFQKLGISQEEVAKASKEELFEKTIKGLSAMEDSTERTTLASQLLGRSSAELGPLLNQGSDAIEEQMEIAEKYGMVMPDSAVKASAAFQDSMTTMQMTAQGLKNRLLGEFLPSMTKVTDGMAKLFTGDMSGLDDVTKGIKGFIDKIGGMAPTVLKAGGEIVLNLAKGLIQKIPSILSAGGKLLGNLLKGLQDSLKNAQPVVSNIVKSIGQFVASNAPQMITVAITLMGTLAQGLVQALPELIKVVPQLIVGIAKAFVSYDWSGVGKEIIIALGKGIGAAASTLGKVLSKPMLGAKNAIVNGFKEAKEKAVAFMDSIKKGATDKINSAKTAVKKAIDKIKSFFPLKIGKLFSGLKLPHFKVSGKAPFGLGGAGEKPKISVSWYKKAYENPYLFTRPTIVDGLGFGDGVGDELLYGKNQLMSDIKTAVADNNRPIENTWYITINGADDPEEWADKFSRRMMLNARAI